MSASVTSTEVRELNWGKKGDAADAAQCCLSRLDDRTLL